MSAADGAPRPAAAGPGLSDPPATVAPVTAAAAADPSAADPGPAQPEPGRGVAARRTRRPARVDPLRVDVSPLEATPLPRTGGGWSCVYADPPWRFTNRTGKVAPEHRRLDRYDTMTAAEIAALPVADVAADNAHLYLWVPNALLPEGLAVMQGWGFRYVSNLVWAKRRKDGGPDGRGVGFYFRNVTELILFGVRGSMRTLDPARRQVNMIETVKREHSRKPDEAYDLIEACSPGPYLEMFARYPREGWSAWGAESETDVTPRGKQYPTYGGGAPHEPGTHSHSDAGESDHAASFGREI